MKPVEEASLWGQGGVQGGRLKMKMPNKQKRWRGTWWTGECERQLSLKHYPRRGSQASGEEGRANQGARGHRNAGNSPKAEGPRAQKGNASPRGRTKTGKIKPLGYGFGASSKHFFLPKMGQSDRQDVNFPALQTFYPSLDALGRGIQEHTEAPPRLWGQRHLGSLLPWGTSSFHHPL